MSDTPTYLVRDIVNGQLVLRPSTEAEVTELRRIGQSDRIVEAPTAELREAQLQQRLESEVEGESGFPLVDSALNAATAGLWSEAIRAGNPAEARRAAVSQDVNDGWSAAGSVIGTLGPTGLALRGTGLAGSLAGATATGGTAAAGQAIARGVAARLTPRLGEAGARAAGGVIGATADAAASGALLALEQSNVHNDPLTADQLLSSIGISGAMGLGLGAVFDGTGLVIGAGRRRAANALAQRLQRGGLEESAARLSQDEGVGRVINPIARIIGSGGDELAPISHARTRQLAVEGQAEVDTLIRNTAETLDNTQRVMGDIIPDQTVRSRRFAELSEQGTDHLALRRAINGFVEGTTGSLGLVARTVVNDDAKALLERAARIVTNLSDNIPGIRNRDTVNALSGGTMPGGSGHILTAMDNAIQGLQGLRLPARATDEADTILNQIGTIRESLEKITRNPDIVGQNVALANDALAASRTSFRNAENQLLSEFGRDVAEGDAVRRTVDTEKLSRMFQELGDPRADRRLSVVQDYLDTSERYRDAVRGVYGVSQGEVDLLSQASQVVRQSLTDGKERITALNTMRTAMNRERGEAGFSIVSGITGTGAGAAVGGLLGSLVGAPFLGAAAGGAASMVAGALLRPASFYARLAHIESALRGVQQRQVNAMGTLRRTLTGRGASIRNLGKPGSRKVPVLIERLRAESTRREEYESLVEEIRELAANPAQMEVRLSTMMGELSQDMPEGLYENMAMSAISGVQYLAMNLPPADQLTPFSHLQKDSPSLSEMDIFAARFHAIEDPMSVLERVSTLQVLPEEVDALRVVYPALYQQIASETASMISDLDSLPPYQARVALGTLLQIPADESLDPSFIQTMQRRSAQTQQQQQTTFGARHSRSVDVAGSTFSESQQVEMRL